MKQKMKNNMEKTLEAAVSFPLPHIVIPRSFLSLLLVCKPVLLYHKFVQKVFIQKVAPWGPAMSQTNTERAGFF